MGACDFMTVGTGRTAQKAFDALVASARDYYGNRGYTGSIAEKSSFVTVDVDHVAARAIAKLQDSRQHYTVKAQKALSKRVAELEAIGHWDEADHLFEHKLSVWGGQTLAEACAAKRKQITADIKTLKTKSKRHRLVAQFELENLTKYGPAGCIKLGRNEYLFFGWAAE